MSNRTATNAFRLSYLKTIGVMNNNPIGRGFGHPVDLTVGTDGRIFVLNRHAGLARIGVCTLGEEYLGEFGSYGHGDGQLWLPTAITVDSRERVYVADEYHHNISVFGSSGEFKVKWGEYGSGEGQIDGPSGLAVDSEDNVFVVDQKNNRVQKFTADGGHLLQWGEQGDSEGQFNLPWGITVDSQGNVTCTSPTGATIASRNSPLKAGSWLHSVSRETATASSTGPPSPRWIQRAISTLPTGVTSAYKCWGRTVPFS